MYQHVLFLLISLNAAALCCVWSVSVNLCVFKHQNSFCFIETRTNHWASALILSVMYVLIISLTCCLYNIHALPRFFFFWTAPTHWCTVYITTTHTHVCCSLSNTHSHTEILRRGDKIQILLAQTQKREEGCFFYGAATDTFKNALIYFVILKDQSGVSAGCLETGPKKCPCTWPPLHPSIPPSTPLGRQEIVVFTLFL